MTKSKVKQEGQIYTPLFIVQNMLDFMGYNGRGILQKNIMENSAGDGVFLVEIVKRYCEEFLKMSNDLSLLHEHLETYIYGIEKDIIAWEQCIKNLDSIVSPYKINVKWNIICKDTLSVASLYYKKMDFVVGNPPYVRVHNLENNYNTIKTYTFSQNGMTDLYLVFFEIGLNMLTKNGKMCLITPSSCLKSKAGHYFREYIKNTKNLSKIIDLEHYQPFEATTYTMITLFDNTKTYEELEYFTYDTKNLCPKYQDTLSYEIIYINTKIYLTNKSDITFLADIENHYKNVIKKSVAVKNGFATLADDVFIGDFNFGDNVIDVVKASTGMRVKCIFPYDENGTPLTVEDIKQIPKLYEYFLKNKPALEKRSILNKDEWFLFGRSQGLKDVFKEKISVNQLIKDKNSLKIHALRKGEGIYGGLYILCKNSAQEIKDILSNDDFLDYVRSLKNYKSGGYYTFSSQDLEKFLTYKLDKRNLYELSFFRNN